jgi:hypothetical protein
MKPAVEPLIVQTADAAKMLSVSVRTLHDLWKTGKIGRVDVVGGRAHYDVAELKAFIARKRTIQLASPPEFAVESAPER